MDTKQRILDEALTLFSEKGYANVYVGEIADRVGIKAPSLYKHYKNKRAIFDAIIDEMNARFAEQAKAMAVNGSDAAADSAIYQQMSEDHLLGIGRQFFLYFLHDDYNRRFRKMLTIEQFADPELAGIYTKLYVDDPMLKTDNVEIMTLHFYAPIYYLLTICDRDPAREPWALETLDAHIKQFNRLYGRKKK